MTADDEHYLLNRDNLAQRIQIQLSIKEKTFPEFFFVAFLKYILTFKHLPKKRDPKSRYVSGSTGCEKYGYINVQEGVFQRTIRQTTGQMGRKSLAI